MIAAEGVRLRAESSGTGETPQTESGEEAHRQPRGKRTPASCNQQPSLTETLYKKIKQKKPALHGKGAC
ncbi:hypothetical protein CEF21_10745 [Bacillus sp. FJAT-42376]|nr:hypothetical protein CEF21_10745 [Bacillus sp. FJAT-42376]